MNKVEQQGYKPRASLICLAYRYTSERLCKIKKVISSYQKVDLLILDEFLLSPVSVKQASALLEIIEARSIKGFVIFSTQFEPDG